MPRGATAERETLRRERIRQAFKDRQAQGLSVGTRKGTKFGPQSAEHKAKRLAARLATQNKMKAEGTYQHNRQGAVLSDKTKRKIGRTQARRNGERTSQRNRERVWTPEMRAKRLEKLRGFKHTDAAKRRMSRTRRKLVRAGKYVNPMKGKTHSNAARAKMSLARRGKSQTPEHVQRRMTASLRTLAQHPNGLERRVLAALIDTFPTLQWQFNPGVVVGRKMPDFVCNVAGLAVDVHGDYWHREETSKDARRRQRAFRAEGYRLVIIWEREFKSDQRVLFARIRRVLRAILATSKGG